jgi:glycosyltransferase involved in cell wall biosynthesis
MIKDRIYPYRLGLQQRVLPRYRADFFNLLASACGGGLNILAGKPRSKEMIDSVESLQTANLTITHNLHLLEGRFYLCYQTDLLGWLSRWDPMALIVEANPRYITTPAAIRWMHRRGRKVIGWGLGSPTSGGGWIGGLLADTRRRFIHQFDALITYSQQGAEDYRRAGYPSERIFVAPNAVTHRPTKPIPLRPVLPGKHLNVLFVGRLQARKRVDLLLEACASLPAEIQPVLWIVGDGPARSELEIQAKKRYPSAEFTGEKHGSELEPYFLRADLFVLPGTGGLAIQQAMSFGLPVLVAEADGTQFDLVRASNGWQVPPGDLETLGKTLQDALSDPYRLRRMGESSYQIVSEEINIESMVNAFLDALGH